MVTFTVIGLQSSSASPKHYAHIRYISSSITCISSALIETQLLSDHAPSLSTAQCLTPKEQQTLCLFVDSYFHFLFFSLFIIAVDAFFTSLYLFRELLYVELLYSCVSMWSKHIPGHLGKHFKCISSCTFMWSGTNCLQSKHIKLTLLPGEKRSYKDHM